ncbi:glycine-rich RNA-binding protein 3, mitochondrial-like isoform X2 [Varroa jacobsoni]|uniref:Uncharacterized protein n=1 Tax=Varroa destructor TaxID=109461 RepID=A0A7M7JZG8_VARDE|nr:glycine-rich RNA-binding protein 3, mitochondrial-like isoform X2 [Varroa destructor]XP_022699254.1 glycine-rich RNA-binding protein 3, mitochondrial-like isoform X2 [Varroa jacobsoni]
MCIFIGIEFYEVGRPVWPSTQITLPMQILAIVSGLILALVGRAYTGRLGGLSLGGHGSGGAHGGSIGGGHGGFVATPVSFGHGGFGRHGTGYSVKISPILVGHGLGHGFGLDGHGHGFHRSLVYGPVKVKGDIHSAKKYAPLAYGHGW